jgi:hypothetical protein
VIVDADVGDEMVHIKLPAGVVAESIITACGEDGRELFASGQDDRLVRIVNAKIAWSAGTDRIVDMDMCTDASVVVTMETVGGERTVAAFARDSGKETGRVAGVLGTWAARDGSQRIEIATASSIIRVARDLAGPREGLEVLPVGGLLAARGSLRLVRASASTAVLLDSSGVRAYLPLAHPGAALGERALIATTWNGSPGETVHRVPYPPRYSGTLRLVRGPARAIVLPAELRDLPPITDAPAAIAISDAKGRPEAIALADENLYALLGSPSEVRVFDLRARTWSLAPESFCPATPIGIVAAKNQVVCAGRNEPGARVRALEWSWATFNVDRVEATASVVLAFDADRITMLDTRGKPIATLGSGNGVAMPAAALDLDGTAMVVTAEQNRIVAHLPYVAMTPVWSVDVHGVVLDITAAGDGVLVTLEDGDAYRIDGRTGEPVAIAGIGSDWRVAGDVITSSADGGPIPPVGWPPTATDAAAPRRGKSAGKATAKTAAPADDEPRPPRLMTPTAPPNDLSPSYHYALYELTGEIRARNDYALHAPATPATRTPGAPLVLLSGDRNAHVALVLDPASGDPLRYVRLPAEALPYTAFSTVVDGKPVVGALAENPLRLLLF